MGSSQSAENQLVASALSAAFKRTVVTEEEYERRRHEPQFANAEKLDLQKMADLSYEPATGKFGDVFGESGKKITVCLKSLSGKKFELEVGKDSYVEELKCLLEKKVEIPIDNDRLVLMYGGKPMQDGCRISEYGVDDLDIVEFTPTFRASAPRPLPLVMSSDLLDPGFNYDFTRMRDDGTEYTRGDHRYSRPYGWKRHALRVQGKYENDTWLGAGGTRINSSAGEWPVSYHGTAHDSAESIAQQGYLLSKCQRHKYGKGIYSTPSIEVATKYASKFDDSGKTYKVVFQNRVSTTGMKIVSKEETDVGEYWVQPNEKLIRPYGVCIKEL